MLHLNLRQDEYFMINDNITIQVRAVEGRHAYLSIDAPRDVPIVRGTVLERGGGKRPECVDAIPKRRGAISKSARNIQKTDGKKVEKQPIQG